MWKFVFSAVLVIAGFNSAGAKLPSYLKLCKRNDPTLHECVLENIEILRPKLKEGIPELYIPSLNPLRIPQATLNSGSSFSATFKDIKLYNVDNFKLESFNVDLDKYHIDIKMIHPSIRIKSIYNINGRILVLNLDGEGPADGNYTNVVGSLALKGTPFQKNNKVHIEWHKEKIDIKIGKAHLFFDRIFGDNQQLNDQTNKVINDNIEGIVEELSPVIQQVVSDVIFSVVNRVFKRYAISDLFPSS